MSDNLDDPKLSFDEFKARFVAELVEGWGEEARETAESDAPLWYDDYLSARMTFDDCVSAAPSDWEFGDA